MKEKWMEKCGSSSSVLLVKNVKDLVTCDRNDRVLHNVDVWVVNGVIVSIVPTGSTHVYTNYPTPGEVIDARNMAMYPGLVNTHHHLYQTFSRNIPSIQGLPLFPWLKALYGIWSGLDEETVRMSAVTGLGELLLCGCTTCLDHHYVFPGEHGTDFLAAEFEAADALGIRLHATRGSMDLSEKDGGLPPDGVVQTIDRILRDSDDAVSRFHDPGRYAMHQVALAPCSPFSASGDLMRETARLARARGVRLHTHLAETKDEERYTLEHFGMRPLEYMESLGWVGSDVWYAHGIHFTKEEIDRLASTGTGVAHCPISNMKLSSGVANVPAMLKAGVHVGLAVDGSASNDGSNLLGEMRASYLVHRLTWGDDAPSAYDILKMATSGSAAVLGRNDIGRISEYMAGDFFMIDERRLALTGAMLDPKSMPATVGFRGNVDYTVVGGRVVVREGKLAGVDEERAAAEADRVMRTYLKKSGI